MSRGLAAIVLTLFLGLAGCIDPNADDRPEPQRLTKRLLLGRWVAGDYVIEFGRRNRGTLSERDDATGELKRWPFRYEFNEEDQTAYLNGRPDEEAGKAAGRRGYLFVEWETEDRRAGELELDAIFSRVRG